MRVCARLVALGALGFAVGCSGIEDLLSTPPDEVLGLTTSASSVPADGESTVIVHARLASAAAGASRHLFFRTSSGAMDVSDCAGTVESPCREAEIIADVNGNAAVAIRNATAGPALVTVSVGVRNCDKLGENCKIEPGEITRSTTVDFSRAWPTRIHVGLADDSFCADSSSVALIDVTATLLRATGVASAGTVVSWSAQGGGVPLGSFTQPSATVVDDTTKLTTTTVKFWPGTGFEGVVTITATVQTPTGAVTGSALLTVKVVGRGC